MKRKWKTLQGELKLKPPGLESVLKPCQRSHAPTVQLPQTEHQVVPTRLNRKWQNAQQCSSTVKTKPQGDNPQQVDVLMFLQLLQ